MELDTKTDWPVYCRSEYNLDFVSWKPVSSALQLKDASQWEQELLDTEVEDTRPLEAVTKLRS
jgi:hypothetical protein